MIYHLTKEGYQPDQDGHAYQYLDKRESAPLPTTNAGQCSHE